MFLTQESGLIMGPVTKLLGLVINWLYNLSSSMGIVGIGLTIIVFTMLIRLILFPSMLKQNKSSKINSYIQPEINKIQKKYRNKKDQESMLKQQQEVREVQEKYGASMTGGCLTSLIQLPIFFAIYNVVQNIPAYVTKIKELYVPIAEAIKNDPNAFNALAKFKEETKVSALKMVEISSTNTNSIIDALAQFPTSAWDSFVENYLGNNSAAVVDAINSNIGSINEVYSFIGGINLMTAPGFKLTLALLIPILSMVFQFLSMNANPIQLTGDPTQDATMKSMKTMMNVMPIMSFFITVNVPAGVGLYWATGSLVSFITSKSIKFYFDKADMEKIVEKSKEKASKKIAKRKAKGKKTFMEKMMEASNGQQPQQTSSRNLASNGSLKSYNSSTMKTQNSGVKYREGSLASKANALQRFNDNNGGKN